MLAGKHQCFTCVHLPPRRRFVYMGLHTFSYAVSMYICDTYKKLYMYSCNMKKGRFIMFSVNHLWIGWILSHIHQGNLVNWVCQSHIHSVTANQITLLVTRAIECTLLGQLSVTHSWWPQIALLVTRVNWVADYLLCSMTCELGESHIHSCTIPWTPTHLLQTHFGTLGITSRWERTMVPC